MLYYEDGMVFEVEVLKNNSNEYFERYTLKVIKSISNESLCKVAKVGYIFECQKRRKSFGTNVWFLQRC